MVSVPKILPFGFSGPVIPLIKYPNKPKPNIGNKTAPNILPVDKSPGLTGFNTSASLICLVPAAKMINPTIIPIPAATNANPQP